MLGSPTTNVLGALYVIDGLTLDVPRDWQAWRDWRRDPAYLARKAAAGDALIVRARAVIPDLDARILYRADASPVTFQRYALSTAGAIYGTQAANGPVPVKTAMPGLVLAGAATHGPGIEAVVISGAFAAEALVPGLLARPAHGPETTENRPKERKAS
ncbi:MAG: hypothetical protein ACFCVA_10420 [Gammaproteobacteria bacterium]